MPMKRIPKIRRGSRLHIVHRRFHTEWRRREAGTKKELPFIKSRHGSPFTEGMSATDD